MSGNFSTDHNQFHLGLVTKLRAAVAQCVLKLFCKNHHARFLSSLNNPEQSQSRALNFIVQNLARTDFGKEHNLTGRESYVEFASKVPIRTYEELEPWLTKQIANKRERIAAAHKIIHVEPTSGSTSASKQIPYTSKLVSSFSNMFAIWVYDLLANELNLETGKIFISVSPKTQNSSGFSNDREYLKEPLKTLLSYFLVSPPQTTNLETFQRELAVTLLNEPSLEIISVWSPTYLLSILKYVEAHRRELEMLLGIALPTRSNSRDIDWKRVWPKLKLISCWNSANAKTTANQLQNFFPHVRIQGKGLLSTEAPITVPLVESSGCAPLLMDIFFEFEDEEGRLRRLHQLQVGKSYQVIISQSSGLTRYRTNDMVQVVGRLRQTPLLEFVGRVNSVCDLVGEKLHETFVRNSLTQFLTEKYFIVVPRVSAAVGYTLLIDSAKTLDTESLARLEEQLCQSHHYKLALMQKQLTPLQVMPVPNLQELLRRFQTEEGMKLGDIKDVCLITDLSRANRFIRFLSGSTGKIQQLLPPSMEETTHFVPASQQTLPVPVEA